MIQVNCETVAVIGGTLANGGVAPITGEKVEIVSSYQITLKNIEGS